MHMYKRASMLLLTTICAFSYCDGHTSKVVLTRLQPLHRVVLTQCIFVCCYSLCELLRLPSRTVYLETQRHTYYRTRSDSSSWSPQSETVKCGVNEWSNVASPKFSKGPNIFPCKRATVQYAVWNTAPRSKKRRYARNLESMANLSSPRLRLWRGDAKLRKLHEGVVWFLN